MCDFSLCATDGDAEVLAGESDQEGSGDAMVWTHDHFVPSPDLSPPGLASRVTHTHTALPEAWLLATAWLRAGPGYLPVSEALFEPSRV